MTVYRSTATAPVNIAVVKYWGKRDAVLNLPTNDSLSVTLDQDDLRALTTAACAEPATGEESNGEWHGDRMWLNGVEKDVTTDKRLQACLVALRSLRRAVEESDDTEPKLSQMTLRIASENNFPTAAGLASSAAGFAALVRAVADLYRLPQSAEELSVIARQGSGSACRSLMGGYVAWIGGSEADGSDSKAQLVAERDHWPEMRAAILVASARKKDVSSTSGMQLTVQTSTLFASRVEKVVPRHMAQMRAAIAERDFASFAEVTMRDSNSFHATCADTYPPIFYMNDTSRLACRLVEAINAAEKETIVAYTFDAGPNAVLYYEAKNKARLFKYLYRACEGVDGFGEAFASSGVGIDEVVGEQQLPESLASAVKAGITRFMSTRVGDGPRKILDQCLVGEDGLPTRVQTVV